VGALPWAFHLSVERPRGYGLRTPGGWRG
jgi:hypothetical protein